MSSVILDISRLISRVRYFTPSGVDRVEMAYARGLLRLHGDDLAFAAVHPSGIYGRIDRAVALSYLDELEHRWGHQRGKAARRSLISVLPWMVRLFPRSRGGWTGGERPNYVQASPHHLVDHAKVKRILSRENARFVCLVHDLIPLEYPEYARPGGAEMHRRRVETIVACADAVIVNSEATGRSLGPWIERSGRSIACHVALLGTEPAPPAARSVAESLKPYFLCLGTIEGRKNHLLLLHLWRQLAQTMRPADVPRLVIVGRRGWENEQVLALLDRCDSLAGPVLEIGGCSDAELAGWMRGANALLMPSFAEGYGMPVAEALAAGVPVICSDIAAHREVGGEVPDFVDPLDGPGWKALVLDYAKNGPARQAQMARLPRWHMPTWDGHMQVVAKAVSELHRRR